MENKLKNLIDLAKSLPESRLDIAIEKLTEIRRESEKEKIRPVPECPKCGGKSVVRNGHQSGKQQYLRKECGGSFVETSDSVIAHSHSGEAVWKQVIRDTIEGTAIDKTAAALELHHETVCAIKFCTALSKSGLNAQSRSKECAKRMKLIF